MDLVNAIMDSAIERYLKAHGATEINLSKLSRETGIGLSSLWFYLRNNRKWPTEAYLKVLCSLGSLTYDQDNNNLIIRFNKNRENSKILRSFLNKDYKNNGEIHP
jgi:hypothetical protein